MLYSLYFTGCIRYSTIMLDDPSVIPYNTELHINGIVSEYVHLRKSTVDDNWICFYANEYYKGGLSTAYISKRVAVLINIKSETAYLFIDANKEANGYQIRIYVSEDVSRAYMNKSTQERFIIKAKLITSFPNNLSEIAPYDVHQFIITGLRGTHLQTSEDVYNMINYIVHYIIRLIHNSNALEWSILGIGKDEIHGCQARLQCTLTYLSNCPAIIGSDENNKGKSSD